MLSHTYIMVLETITSVIVKLVAIALETVGVTNWTVD